MFIKRSAPVVAGVVLAALCGDACMAQLARPSGGPITLALQDREPVVLRAALKPPPAKQEGRAEAKIPLAIQNKKQALMTRAGPMAQGDQVINCDPATLNIAPEGSATVMGDLMVINNAKTVCPNVGKTFTPPPGLFR
ncbi:hypothetical protein [Caulobacter endophyticus]|uniref:hypothetical protein n=1 Tax=Caulobacter endophyticus TaxID=2172652 RepID=UPI00240EFFEF|nr:hypothetical protein [Caulobacter endophyticus]MDG2528917.1 hypothetical protein [Caulobacter endophyticus]